MKFVGHVSGFVTLEIEGKETSFHFEAASEDIDDFIAGVFRIAFQIFKPFLDDGLKVKVIDVILEDFMIRPVIRDTGQNS